MFIGGYRKRYGGFCVVNGLYINAKEGGYAYNYATPAPGRQPAAPHRRGRCAGTSRSAVRHSVGS